MADGIVVIVGGTGGIGREIAAATSTAANR